MYTTKFPLNSRIIDFPDPFMSFSNIIYPSTVQEVFHWADRLWLRNGIYSQAIKKCVRYFLNDIELAGEDLSHDTRKKYQEFLLEQMNVLDELGQVGDDVIAYGNSFTSVSVPIKRHLVCPKEDCGLSRPLITLQKGEDYEWKEYSFVGDCPQCGAKKVKFKRVDSSGVSKQSKIKIIRWAPQQISIKHCTITGESDYYYDIPADDKTKIKEGDPVYLRSIPWELVEAVKNDRPFKFNKETFYHLRCNTAANLLPTLKGWGLPLFMSNFSQVVHLQILERYNEAIAMDYIVPFRVLTPPQKGGGPGSDPMLSNNMGNFMGAARRMIKQHRQDPTTWHTLPFPLEYQALGGEAKNLVPVDLIDRAVDNLLTSMGVPQEFYRGSISMTAGPPISLRMFEKTWTHYTTMLDDWLGWFLDQCGRIMEWESNIVGKLERTSIVEDDMGKQVKLNLASAKVISNRTALKAFGIDVDREREQTIEEDRIMNELMREEQKKDEQTQMLSEQMAMIPPNAAQSNMGLPPDQAAAMGAGGGGPMMMDPAAAGGGAMPAMGGGGGGSPSLDDVMAEAEMMAQQIMSMDPTTRRNELTNLKKSNPTLHAQVKQMLQDMEQGIKSNALAQAKMQAQQGGGMM
jgi:hypothetical protein